MAQTTPDPTLQCPHCKRSFPLTETLAAPLIEAARREAVAEIDRREQAVAEREADVRRSKAAVETLVARRVGEEREQIEAVAREQATAGVALQIKDLQSQVAEKTDALQKAQEEELALRGAMRKFEEEKESWRLEKERQIDAERRTIRENARAELEEHFRLKGAEKDELINAMKKQIDDLRRKADQGSQQAQGEIQELDIEATLQSAFPLDGIDPVAKGVRGADCVQRVALASGVAAGSILWESKRTKSWSDTWLPKLRDDQREAKADIAILVTSTLPKSIARFGLLDGVWVTDLPSSLPLAQALRFALMESAAARAASTGRETKMGLLYEYLCSPRFRQRVESIVEAFSTMKADLDKEKRAIQSAWAKREQQIERALLGTAGMYGDLQGIAGSTLPEIQALELPGGESPKCEDAPLQLSTHGADVPF